jgi:hypothetical protein
MKNRINFSASLYQYESNKRPFDIYFSQITINFTTGKQHSDYYLAKPCDFKDWF